MTTPRYDCYLVENTYVGRFEEQLSVESSAPPGTPLPPPRLTFSFELA